MKVSIEFECEPGDLHNILGSLQAKIEEQLEREPGCICTAPEDADLIRNWTGARCGTIEVEGEDYTLPIS